MKLFDYFKKKNSEIPADKPFNGENERGITTFSPKSFDDLYEIIDLLAEKKPAIVDLSAVREGTAQRVLDILTGAICALGGNMAELKKEAYIFTPSEK